MLTVFVPSKIDHPLFNVDETTASALKEAVYIDLLMPTAEEEQWVKAYCQVNIPALSDMQEIEPSNRLYQDGEVLYLTVTVVAKSDSQSPTTDPITFILTKDRLITIRYSEPQAFSIFFKRLLKSKSTERLPPYMLLGIIEASIDRLADILEGISHRLDNYSQHIFRPLPDTFIYEPDYKEMLQNIGANGDLGAKVRDSLISFSRMVNYLAHISTTHRLKPLHKGLQPIIQDISALDDFATFISNKASFLLSSTLGMVNIEQNNIIKIFSVAAVIFLPPTLIASIYGMNFIHIPELEWWLGYPLSLVLMVLSAWLPYRFFKRKKWF